MHPALWVSKTGLDAQQTNISTISNNLANASTIGFKKSRAVFEDLFYQNINQPGEINPRYYLAEWVNVGGWCQSGCYPKSIYSG